MFALANAFICRALNLGHLLDPCSVGHDTGETGRALRVAAVRDQRGHSSEGRNAPDVGHEASSDVSVAHVRPVDAILGAEVVRDGDLEELLTAGVDRNSLEGTVGEIGTSGRWKDYGSIR